MPQVAALPDDPAVLKELMRQKGLIATGGNYRLLPFEDDAAGSVTSSNGTAPYGSASGATAPFTATQDGQIVDPTGAVVATVDETGQISDPALDIGNINWTPFLAGAAGAAMGWAIADALRKRGKKVDGTPLVEGEVIPNDPNDPNARIPRGTVEGEFSEVDAQRGIPYTNGRAPSGGTAGAVPVDGPTVVGAIAEQRRLSGPRNALPDYPSPPNYPSRREIATRRTKNAPNTSRNANPAIVTDALTDVSDEERKVASAIADQLIARRREGNMRRMKGGKGVGRKGLPTGSTDKDNVVNSIIRTLRQTGALKSMQSAFN